MKKIIHGSGGGGKGGGGSSFTPSEETDSLQSKSFAQILDLVSEGEIEGLVDGHKSIYFDETPLQNPDNSYNFGNGGSGIQIVTRNGTQNQSYIEGFVESDNEHQVNTEVKNGIPVVRTITNPNIDAVNITIAFPQMTYQDPSSGNLSGADVIFAIDIQSNGGGYEEKIRDRVVGKCVSKYTKQYRFTLIGSPPWDIRVRRITADSTSVTLNNKTYFDSYTEIIDGKLKYPNSALVGIRIDSSQFNSIPTRGYHVRGLRIKVPDNYDYRGRIYTGAWTGNFQISWTDNPAWIFYDLLTSKRYGLGNYIDESLVDKWSLYTIAKYCDELVPDGSGGYEPRFTCNAYIQTRSEAFKLIQDLLSCFRAMGYWSSGSITAVQDAPSDPAFIFNNANVINGQFNYSGTSARTRHTSVLVAWNDPNNFYKQTIEYVEDTDLVAKYGVIETQITAFGCTSRGQAHRLGRWLLFSEHYQTETVSFKAGLDSVNCKPGQIIAIADQLRSGSRMGGRVLTSTNTTVNVDQDYALDPNLYTLSVNLPDGSLCTRKIKSISGKTIEVFDAFPLLPQSLFVLESSILKTQLFKIISIKEDSGIVYDITAVAHDPSKFNYVEKNLLLEDRKITDLNIVPSTPTNLIITETLYDVANGVKAKVTLSWDSVLGAASYNIQYKKDQANPVSTNVSTNDFEILDVDPGLYTFFVSAVSFLGKESDSAYAQKSVLGLMAPPENVQNFSLVPQNGFAYLSWDKAIDKDVLNGGNVRIRYTPNTTGQTWRDAIDIVPAIPGSETHVVAPLLPGTYMAKFVDSSKLASLNEVMIVTTIPNGIALNVIHTINETLPFAGAKSGTDVNTYYSALALTSAQNIDSVLINVDDIPNWDYAGGVNPSGTYDFTDLYDLGGVFTSRVTAIIDGSSIDVADTIDQRTTNIDDWLDIDGVFIDDANVEIWLKTTNDDPASPSAAWTDWKKFFVSEYTARGYKFQLRLFTNSDSHNVIIRSVLISIDVPDRVLVNPTTITSGASSYTVTYPEPFYAQPALSITAKDLANGDRFNVTSESASGFTITFYNSSGTVISRKFDYFAKGYGRKVA